uniref:Uncharacterized protein n=1 Tax=Sipha flava TaxID=143950 RepID=A0A2S2QGP6_9HEMI
MENGVNILFFTGKLYFELELILRDNLGLHLITGFVESFSSNFCCRICIMEKSDIKVKCYEDKSLFRNIEQYFNDLKNKLFVCNRIKRRLYLVKCYRFHFI